MRTQWQARKAGSKKKFTNLDCNVERASLLHSKSYEDARQAGKGDHSSTLRRPLESTNESDAGAVAVERGERSSRRIFAANEGDSADENPCV
jgi:hypothetical protein